MSNVKIMKYLKNHFVNTVKGKDVVLIGSAPNFDGQFQFDDSKILVTVNGASLALKSHLIPDLCFFSTSVMGTEHSGKETRQHLEKIKAKHFVVVEGMAEWAKDWTRLLTECKANSFDFYSIERRMQFFTKALKIESIRTLEDLPSTGFFVLFLLLTSGAKSVALHGFSLINGHSYTDTVYQRFHIDADARLINLIQKSNFPVRGEIPTKFGSIVL